MNWTITSGIVGILGLLAIPAAFLILHLQNRSTKRVSVSEQQQEIYKEALDTLGTIEDGIQQIGFRLLTSDEINRLDLEKTSNLLEKLAKDPATPMHKNVISVQILYLNSLVGGLPFEGIPEASDVALVLRQPDQENINSGELHSYLRKMINKGVHQHDQVRKTKEQCKIVRSGLEDYRKGIVKINPK